VIFDLQSPAFYPEMTTAVLSCLKIYYNLSLFEMVPKLSADMYLKAFIEN
jgi:hypothetical protein